MRVNGVFSYIIRKSQQITFCPISSLQRDLQPLILRQEILFRYKNKDEDLVPTTNPYHVTIELSRGGHLVLGQNVSINVKISQTDLTCDDIILNDYQAMLIQETVSRVGFQSQRQRLLYILRTVSNLNIAVGLADKPPGTTVALSDNSWGMHSVPATITPTFELCNINHSYKLEIRLGFKGGPKKVGYRC